MLADPAARRAYVDAVNLHSALLWDNAGVDATPVASLAAKRPNRRLGKLAAAALAVATLVAVAVFLPGPNDPPGQPVAVEATPAKVAAPEETPPVSETPSATRPVETAIAASPVVPPPVAEKTADPRDGLPAFIDARLAAAWDENELTPAPRAAAAQWLRRASLDIRGRVPTRAEIAAFRVSDPATRRADYRAEALASREAAEHFASVWSTLLVGRSPERAEFRQRLHPWLADAIEDNRPWGEVAGQLVAARGPQSNPPTNFLLAHLNDQAVPATAITSRVLLCRQVQCVQCHDHPFNTWDQGEFWSLNAFFAGCEIRSTSEGPVLADRDATGPVFFEDRRGLMKVAYPVFAGESIPEDAADRRDRLAKLMAGDQPGPLAEATVNRLWHHFHGAAFTAEVDDMGPHAAVSHPQLLARLSAAFVASGYDLRQLAGWITGAKSYDLAAAEPGEQTPSLFAAMSAKPLSPEQLYDSLLTAAAGPGGATLPELPNRAEWAAAFYHAGGNEENGDASTFEPSAGRSLELMNGPLVAGLVDSPDAAALRDVFSSDETVARKAAAICELTLGRPPTDAERESLARVLRPTVRLYARELSPEAAAAESLKDVFWAYVNTREFAVNR